MLTVLFAIAPSHPYDIISCTWSVGGVIPRVIWAEPSFPDLAGLLFASESVLRLIHGCTLFDAILLHPLPKKPDIAWKLRKLALTALRLSTPLCCSMGQPSGARRGQKVLLWASCSVASTVAKMMLCHVEDVARDGKIRDDDGCDKVYDDMLKVVCCSHCNGVSVGPLALPFLLTRAIRGWGTQGSLLCNNAPSSGNGPVSRIIYFFLHLLRIIMLSAPDRPLPLAVLICGPVPELLMACIGITTSAIPMTSTQCDRVLANVHAYGVVYLMLVTEAAASIGNAESDGSDVRLIGQGLCFLLSSPLMDLMIQVSHADAGEGETMAKLVGKAFRSLGSLLCHLVTRTQVAAFRKIEFFRLMTDSLNAIAIAMGSPDPGRACWLMDTPTSLHVHFRCEVVINQIECQLTSSAHDHFPSHASTSSVHYHGIRPMHLHHASPLRGVPPCPHYRCLSITICSQCMPTSPTKIFVHGSYYEPGEAFMHGSLFSTDIVIDASTGLSPRQR